MGYIIKYKNEAEYDYMHVLIRPLYSNTYICVSIALACKHGGLCSVFTGANKTEYGVSSSVYVFNSR